MMEETETELCYRIGNKLAEDGQHERAAAWKRVAALNALFDHDQGIGDDILLANTGSARG